MIAAYIRKEVLQAFLSVSGAVLCYAIAFAFFYAALAFTAAVMGFGQAVS